MVIKRVSTLLLPTLALGLILPSCKGKTEQQQQAPELAVLTVSEENTTLESGMPTTLEGENDIEIRPQVQGFLTKVCVEEGQKVSKGQTLFVIDQVQLQAAVDAAQAAVDAAKSSVAVAQANVNTAKTNMDNNKMLLDKNIISKPAYQTSVDSYNAAVAQLNATKSQIGQAMANLTSAKRNLAFSVVTAPEAGVVGQIPYREGSLVSPQSLLTVLSNNSDMRATFALNEKDILALTDDGKRSLQDAIAKMPEVTLTLANGERYNHPGKIISISGVIDPSTGSATAKAIFPNPQGMLHSGNTGTVNIPQVKNNVMLIPQAATYEMQDMKFVYVVNDSNKVKSRSIQVADQNDGQNYIVVGGLKPGERIVTEGVGISVRDDMVITPKK
ncbi:MAG: efflux RND transporter periplasmic adaptor subunit [Bacteroidales bacterium]|nr:efflux RND transporter periplasmic adaptor subunit [Bacteroidales bacterium]MBD5224071.1 efflux RND transporter periplasmic adaptor subunit [Bacteroidales bacterium]